MAYLRARDIENALKMRQFQTPISADMFCARGRRFARQTQLAQTIVQYNCNPAFVETNCGAISLLYHGDYLLPITHRKGRIFASRLDAPFLDLTLNNAIMIHRHNH